MGGKKYPKKDQTPKDGSTNPNPAPRNDNQPGPNQQRPNPNQPNPQQFQQMNISSGQQRQQPQGQQGRQSQQQQQPRQQQQQQQPRQQQGQRQEQQPRQQRGQRQEQQPRQQQQGPHQRQQAKQQSQNQPPQQQSAWSQPPRSQSTQSVRSESSQGSSTAQKPPQQQQQQRATKSQQQQINQPAPGPSTVGQKQVQTKMEHLLCPYKGPGTLGRKVILETNYLKIILKKLLENAYHYDVKFEPDRPRKFLTKVFQIFCRNNFPKIGIAFDGAQNAYAPQILNLKNIIREVDFTHPDTGGVRRYLVSITETDDMEIPLKSLQTYTQTRQYDMPRRALQCLEIVLKGAFQQAHLENGIQAGRSFFLPPQKREYLGDYFELWLGLFQSTVLGNSPYLNVDVAHKAFPKRYHSLVALLEDIKQENPRTRDPFQDMRTHLRRMDVIYKTPGNAGQMRVYKFMDLVGTPKQERFTDENGRQLTIADYFREHNYPINYPALPCVQLGNNLRSIKVPMEHCSLSDCQAINKKCTENQTRNIIRFAATSTDVRKQKIFNLLNQVKHNNSSIIQNFGLQLDMNFAKVPARLLDAPLIEYSDHKTERVVAGVWRGEGKPFLIPESANRWAILNTNQRTRRNELQDLERMFYRISRPTNLNLAERADFIQDVDSRDIRKIQGEMDRAKAEGIRILFCIIPDSGPTYAKIKQTAELQVGILTQCIKGGTVFKKRNDGSTISNILLKVNAKLNGTNHRLNASPILYDKCMIVGADVTHPSPDQRDIPSVVGVAASHDSNAFCYNACWRLQGPRVEIIEDFEQIILEHLKYYMEKNKCLPNKILYYRDGVSEGQFQQVMATEKMAMQRACQKIAPGYEKKVKLTIVVVQKRHHTRFFPTQNMGDKRNNNVPAGTIVDTEITHPQENHFYLVSHQSIQGVAKPTKYCILLDDANHTIDDLQGLSYNLCHLFSRCNRSVSYPAPTYYAHLAAYRGRVYIENERLNMNKLQNEWQRRSIRNEIVKGHPMFFV